MIAALVETFITPLVYRLFDQTFIAEYSQRIICLFDGQIVSENIQKKIKL